MLRAVALAGALAMVAGGTLAGVAIADHGGSSAQDAQRRHVDQRARAEAAAPPRHPGAMGVSSIVGDRATLVVPALQVRAPIVATGGVNGAMVIPDDIREVGWYDGINATSSEAAAAAAASDHTAPWPGQAGVALLAGHVDWAGRGPGALYYLARLRVGDPIQVVGANGVATTWRVSEAPITRSKSDLPPGLFANTGPPRLALVTCGGAFDAATGHYQDNVIVWADPA